MYNPIDVAAALQMERDRRLQDHSDWGRINRYLKGNHDLPYTPKSGGAAGEFSALQRKSITNWLPLISDTFGKSLFVDGFRSARDANNSDAWRYWQVNKLDARQTVIHRSTINFGLAFTLVLPGDPAPVITCLRGTRVIAEYEDEDSEYPEHALVYKGKGPGRVRLYDFLDATSVTSLAFDGNSGAWGVMSTADHGLGVTPLVRFRETLDEESTGIILPLIPIQDRVNESVFNLMIALQYASFRQRWATGLDIPVDPSTNRPIDTFQAAVNRVWTTDSPDARFGDFAQTDVSGHLQTYEQTVKTLAGIAQVPPTILMGSIHNISTEALAGLQDSTQRRLGEYETLFGESWEATLRLAAVADGSPLADDEASQIRWRDTEARALAATVDALGKMASMLSIPAEGLWERVPGVTDQDVERWKVLAAKNDITTSLVSAMTRQAMPAVTPGAPPVAAGAPLSGDMTPGPVA